MAGKLRVLGKTIVEYDAVYWRRERMEPIEMVRLREK